MRDVFTSRWFRVTALLWVVGFFVVFVPAHRRGIVALPTGHVAQADETNKTGDPTKPYCPLCTPWSSANGGEPAPDAPVSCAICHLKTNLDTPPTVILPPTFVDELEFALYEMHAVEMVSASPQHRILGRAPPIHA